MQPSLGADVLYTLSEDDATQINRRRSDFHAFGQSHAHPHEPGQPGATGHVGHVGNFTRKGDVCPAKVVRTFDETVTTANLQVYLDGNDTYWATSRRDGEGPGTWAYPAS